MKHLLELLNSYRMVRIQAIHKFFPLLVLLLLAGDMGNAANIDNKNAGGADAGAKIRPLSTEAKANNHYGDNDTSDNQINFVHVERFLKEYYK